MITHFKRLDILARILQVWAFIIGLFYLVPVVINFNHLIDKPVQLSLLFQLTFICVLAGSASKILKAMRQECPAGIVVLSAVFILFAVLFSRLSADALSPFFDRLSNAEYFYNKYMAGKIESLSGTYDQGALKVVPDWIKTSARQNSAALSITNPSADAFKENADQFIHEIQQFKERYVDQKQVPLADGIICLASFWSSLLCLRCFYQLICFSSGTLQWMIFTIAFSFLASLLIEWQWYYWRAYGLVLETKYYFLVNVYSPEIFQTAVKSISYVRDFYINLLKNIFSTNILPLLFLFIFIPFYFQRPEIKMLYPED